MIVMAFQSSPIFSLPRARLECSVFRFMLPLGVLPVSYYHGEVRREATEAARGREFRSHSLKYQTTAIDSAVRMANLTTMLAHASGEWTPRIGRSVAWLKSPILPACGGADLSPTVRPFHARGDCGQGDLDAPDSCAPAEGQSLRAHRSYSPISRLPRSWWRYQPTLSPFGAKTLCVAMALSLTIQPAIPS